jgi:hypothetical protein
MSKTTFNKLSSALSALVVAVLPINAMAVKQATPAKPATAADSTTYKNKTYGFSFTVPNTWKKQNGEPDSDNVLFMRSPLSNSCSFQFMITPMPKDFPAEISVVSSLKAAEADIGLGKNLSAKRRDDKGTKGWEIAEKGQKGGHQRIIYQVYDAQNRLYNFNAAAYTEKFSGCQPDLSKIIDSIKFE